MASFVARLLERSGVALPDQPEAEFADVPAGAAHATAIGQLAQLGVVRGFDGGRYRPGDVVSRAQMASSSPVPTAWRPTASRPPPGRSSTWPATPTSRAIGTLAALGITEGITPTHYAPGNPVTREQMASFLARTVNLLVVGGKVAPE
jgi:hypothetical protein